MNWLKSAWFNRKTPYRTRASWLIALGIDVFFLIFTLTEAALGSLHRNITYLVIAIVCNLMWLIMLRSDLIDGYKKPDDSQ